MKREVREQRLHDLVERYLVHVGAPAACGVATNDLAVEIIAHSPQSPIALAVAARLPQLRAAGVTIRAIFGVPSPDPLLADWLAHAGWVRWARDKRLMEAHEQLVLGTSRCWSGDAMRRGGTKTDLFESLNEGCVESAATSRRAFEKLAPRASVIRSRRVTASLCAMPADRPTQDLVAVEGVVPTMDLPLGVSPPATRH